MLRVSPINHYASVILPCPCAWSTAKPYIQWNKFSAAIGTVHQNSQLPFSAPVWGSFKVAPDCFINNITFSFICILSVALPLAQISFASPSADLKDRERFRTHFQMYPPDDTVAPSIVTLVDYYGWTRMSIITEKQNTYLKVKLCNNTVLGCIWINTEALLCLL